MLLTQQTLAATRGSASSEVTRVSTRSWRLFSITTCGNISHIRPSVQATESLTTTDSSPIKLISIGVACNEIAHLYQNISPSKRSGCQLVVQDSLPYTKTIFWGKQEKQRLQNFEIESKVSKVCTPQILQILFATPKEEIRQFYNPNQEHVTVLWSSMPHLLIFIWKDHDKSLRTVLSLPNGSIFN